MRENSYLADREIKLLKGILLSEKERLLSKDKNLLLLDKNELSDPVDEASINIQASQDLRFKSRDIFYLKKINQSLLKIEEGTHGLCKDCDDEIGMDRLRARPTAELCISCKEESEKDENNNIHQRKSKSFGQTLSERVAR